ncbi:MAG: hypothetical protein ACJ8GM_13800 [Paraburkholderia fungorum]
MPSVQDLIARRRAIAQQMRQLQEELQHLDDAIFGAFDNVATMFSSGQTNNWPVSLESPTNALHRDPHRRNANRAEEFEMPTGDRRRLMPAVVHVLTNARGPVRTRELLDYLTSMGVEVGGKNPANNLAAHLSSMDMVTSTPDGWVMRGQGR